MNGMGKRLVLVAMSAALAGCQPALTSAPPATAPATGAYSVQAVSATDSCMPRPYAVFALGRYLVKADASLSPVSAGAGALGLPLVQTNSSGSLLGLDVKAEIDDDVLIVGTTGTVDGDMHANNSIRMIGLWNRVLGVAEAVKSFWTLGLGNRMPNKVKSTKMEYPVKVDPETLVPTYDFPGDVVLADVAWIWAAPGKLKPGVYRAKGAMVVAGVNVEGNVTLVANTIVFAGVKTKLRPYAGGVLAYAKGGLEAIDVVSLDGDFAGMLDAPAGEVVFAGTDNVLNGMVQAASFKMAGLDNTIRFADYGYCGWNAPASPAPTPTVAATPTPTPTPSGTPTPTPSPSGLPSTSPAPSASPEPSVEPASPAPTTSPAASAQPTQSPAASAEPSPSPVVGSPAPTPSPTPTPSPSPSGPSGGLPIE